MLRPTSASLSWNKAPIWGLRPDLYYCQTVADLLMWGAVSDERTGLSFTIAAGPSQRSHSQVRDPWDLRPYFTVSDLRLPITSPPTTRRVTMEVFDPASTREANCSIFRICGNCLPKHVLPRKHLQFRSNLCAQSSVSTEVIYIIIPW
jgi:hypothetical protein